MSTFPTSLDSFTNPTANDTLAAVPHHTQHSDANDAIEALEAKVGTGSSTPTSGKVLVGNGTGTSTWGDAPKLVGTSSGRTITDETGGSDTYSEAPARKWSLLDGTYAAPVTTLGPTLRVHRWENLTAEVMTNPFANEYNAAIHGASFQHPSSTAQAAGVYGMARGGASVGNADLCGVLATARMENEGGTSVAAGLYAQGTRLYDTCLGTFGMEVRTKNQTLTDSTYSGSQSSPVTVAWLTAGGTAKTGAFIQTKAVDAAAIALVGIGFCTGSVQDSTVRDDTSSTVSIDINGTHTYGVDMSGATLTAAMVVPNGTPGSILALDSGGTARRVLYMNTGDTLIVGEGVPSVIYLQKETQAGEGLYLLGQNIRTDGTTGMKIGTGSTQKLGFYGATPIVRPTGVAVSAAGIHAALVSLGLIAA